MIFNHKKFCILFAIIFFCTSCVRYIDSRKDLVDEFGGFDPAAKRVGIDGFYRFEQEQRKRLEMLIKERESDLINNPGYHYRIGPGDELRVTIKNFREISKEYRVGTGGTIRLPFIGNVEIEGLTEGEAAEFVAELVTDYVIDPMVDVEVNKYSANVVWVMNASTGGEVIETKYKNSFPLKRRDYSLVDLLIELEDPAYLNTGVIYLYPAADEELGSRLISAPKAESLSLEDRFNSFGPEHWSDTVPENIDCNGEEFQEDGSRLRTKACYPYESKITSESIQAKYSPRARIEIDVEELFGAATAEPLRVLLRPGDLVYIPETPLIQVFGEVRRRGSYRVTSGSQRGGGGGNTLKPSLFSAIAAAQGLTYGASIGEIQIYRELQFGNKSVLTVDMEKIVLWGGQDVKLRDGDIVYVPSQSNRFYEEHSINSINRFVGAITNTDDLRAVGD